MNPVGLRLRVHVHIPTMAYPSAYVRVLFNFHDLWPIIAF
jgi:hypothetical protein